MGVTPAPDHLEALGTEQLRLVPEEAVETLALQRSQEAVLGSEDGEEEAVEVTASVAEPGDQGERGGDTSYHFRPHQVFTLKFISVGETEELSYKTYQFQCEEQCPYGRYGKNCQQVCRSVELNHFNKRRQEKGAKV